MAKKHLEINDLINRILDINYLFKRIEFLELAISTVLESHQLKGIHLSRSSLADADLNYKKHRIRERLIKFLYLKMNET